MSLRRLGAVAAIGLAVGLGSCGDREAPFDQAAGTAPAPAAAPTTPADGAISTEPWITPVPPTTATSPAEPTDAPSDAPEISPQTPADAPSPAGATPDPASKTRQRPRSLQGRIEADGTAKLNVRTMVSIIEGCHAGRSSYKSCNTHAELGGPDILGLTIGKRRGDVQISATDNGFRITGHSMSGAKFTVARGPRGDRFKCIEGRMPGDCPADRTWTW